MVMQKGKERDGKETQIENNIKNNKVIDNKGIRPN
jgi:hypothetical protein